jgi:putative transposase
LLRRRRGPLAAPERKPREIARRLSEQEQAHALGLLHTERFVDLAVPQVHAQLLDEGLYVCSMSTMYRLLRAQGEVQERRRIARHPEYRKPELPATGPRQVFSWDITKIRGPYKGVWFSLLVMLDIFSRFVVGWQLVRRANAAVAEHFIRQTLQAEGIEPGQVAVHSDRGPEMIAQSVCDLLDSLAVMRSLSRPHVSDDNPYSEAQFKTLKYHRDFPERFGSLEDGKGFFRGFFGWYNFDHRHSGIAMLSPAIVHTGQADAALEARHTVMLAAYAATPERFVKGPPKRELVPAEVWINRPNLESAA